LNCTTQWLAETTWHSFPNGYHPIRLEVEWNASATRSGGIGSSVGEVRAKIEYSLDNGSSWSTLEEYVANTTTPNCPTPSDQSIKCSDHVATVNLGDYQNTDQIRVRASLKVQMTSCSSCGPLTTHNITGVMNVDDIRVIVDNCRIPLAETTNTDSWHPTIPTVHRFKMTLTPPSGVTFNGRTVKEFNPGGGGPDTCKEYDPNSPYAASTTISGGEWTVNSSEEWMYDNIGWLTGPVEHYRSVGAAPCGTTIPQQMKITCVAGAYVPYRQDSLNLDIGTTTVTSTRDGVPASRTWP
jgi:hypothetical protein